jgi:ABC-type antimicrobial peptide transport system permease subunit
MFKTNRLRTLLTILGISVGIGTILFLVSLGYGLQQVLISQITTSDAMLSMDIMTDSSSPVRLDKENIKKIESLSGIAEISPMFSTGAQMKVGDLTGDILVNLSNASFLRLSGMKVSKGDVFKEDNENKIIISTAGLLLFNLDPDSALGKKARFNLFIPKKNENGEVTEDLEVKYVEKEFEIGGIIDDGVSSYAFLALGAIEDLDIPYYSHVKVKVKEQKLIEPVRGEIIGFGFIVTALSDTITDANRIFNAIQMILSVFGAVALLVSAIGMFNTMTIALLERTQEIGIMKALGAARRDIWKMFLAESVIIGFLGGLGGILIGDI